MATFLRFFTLIRRSWVAPPSSPERGCPCKTLSITWKGGESIDEFLAGFPTVTRHQVIGFIEAATEKLLAPACSWLTWGQDNPESNAVAPVGRAAVAAER